MSPLMRVSSSSVGRQAMKLPNLIFVCIQILAKICIIKKYRFTTFLTLKGRVGIRWSDRLVFCDDDNSIDLSGEGFLL